MTQAVETIFNEESSKSKIRGHDGYVNKARSHKPSSKCLKEQVLSIVCNLVVISFQAYEDYAKAMEKLLLNEDQQKASA